MDLQAKICRLLHIREDEILSYTLKKQSLDARKKPQLFYVYTIDVTVKNENEVKKHVRKQKQLTNIQILRRSGISWTQGERNRLSFVPSLWVPALPACSAGMSLPALATAQFFWNVGPLWKRG